jgi:hypothetical protein
MWRTEQKPLYYEYMEFLLFVGGIILFFYTLNLQGRVSRIESSLKVGTAFPREESVSTRPSEAPISSVPQGVVPDQLRAYIQQQCAFGVDKETIINALVGIGWEKGSVEKAFAEFGSKPKVPFMAVSGQTEQTALDRFFAWMKEDWLLKLGALLLVIGFGWLTTYAFLNNWIGPMGRITFGLVAGATFMALGWWRIQKYIHQGGVFLVLGSTVVLMTIFAARELYQFFTPATALAVMFLSTAFVGLASVKYNSRSLALASLILAGCAPLLTNAPPSSDVMLFAYLFVVVLGAIWIAVVTGRRELTGAALILVTFYSTPYFTSGFHADKGTLLLFAYAFTAVFFFTNTAGIVKLKGKDIIPDLITAGGNGLFLLVWITSAAQDEWKSLIIASWMVVFTVGAFLVFKITQRKEPFYVYAGMATAFLVAATSAELHGATLTIAYTLECIAVAVTALLVTRDVRTAEQTSWLLILPVLRSFESIVSNSWSTGVVHKDFFVLFILAVTFIGLGLFFLSAKREMRAGEVQGFHMTHLVVGSVYAYILIWLSFHAILRSDSTAVLLSLLVYMLVGLVSYFSGLAKGSYGLRVYGGVLIGGVVLRLFLVDVWDMEMSGRIVTFFLLGALLMGTAFIGKKKREEHLSA